MAPPESQLGTIYPHTPLIRTNHYVFLVALVNFTKTHQTFFPASKLRRNGDPPNIETPPG